MIAFCDLVGLKENSGSCSGKVSARGSFCCEACHHTNKPIPPSNMIIENPVQMIVSLVA